MHILCGVLLTAAAAAAAMHTNPAPYFTNFSVAAEVLAQWTQATTCEHCASRDGECTQMTAAATTFGSVSGGAGMTHTTSAVAPSATSCDANVTSGHIIWDPPLLYGTVRVVARWFPGPKALVQSATGFIGLDSSDNVASITLGFHGLGCPKGPPLGPFGFQHGAYANVSRSHHQGYTDTGSVNLATTFNEYAIEWTPKGVVWSFNGAEVASMTKADDVPGIPMRVRLHTRSGWNSLMPPPPASFVAQFKSFSYTPPP